ncbi:MAG: HAD family hydrolase, partial [Candidatus Wallbacteria bacterium]|nr:HAD family hydrolase [Candidatus Wallbacteria bacterium]
GQNTIMVGNSPRSDINPALEAGWWAVYLKRELIWELESEQLPASGKLFMIEDLNEIIRIAGKIRG